MRGGDARHCPILLRRSLTPRWRLFLIVDTSRLLANQYPALTEFCLITRARTNIAIFISAFASFAPVSAVPAAAAEFSLQGKTVNVIVSGGVGGGVDLYARTLLPYLSKYLPGNPTTVVQNMPGAGGIQGVQALYNMGAKDGTAIATTPAGPIKEPLMGSGKVNYDLRQFHWVGSLTVEDTACLVWHTSELRTLDDAKKRDVPLSATGAASNSTLGPLLLNNLLGTKFKPISGYDGGTSMLAVERGEVEGRCTTLNSVRGTKARWIADKLVRALVMMSDVDDPDFPDVPKARSLMKNDEDKQAFEFFQAADEIQNPYMLPPGTPGDVIEIYRKAFDAAVHDPEFRALTTQRQMNIVPRTGGEVQAKIEAMYATPPAIMERVKRAIAVSAGK
jgi:tripartite-type tricarboxylate transporter receptor subunit TctC